MHSNLNTYAVGGKFNINKIYRAIQPVWRKVQWKQQVLLRGLVPKHQFNMWLAVQRRLATVDRLKKWGIHVAKKCVLYNTNTEETLDHLFFQYPYTRLYGT